MALLLSSISLLSTILLSSSPALSSPLTLPLLPSTNITSTPWDAHFSIRAGYSSTRLRPTSVLTNAVNAAARLATLDFNKRLTGIQIPPLANYPDVHIEFIPAPPATGLEAKMLVWGLYGGINDMVGTKRFREVEFDLLWKGAVVAWMRVEKAEGRMLLGASNGIQSAADLTSPPPLSFAFAAQYTPYAKPLSVFQVFMAVLSALVQIAPFSARAVVKPLAYEAQDFNSRVVVVRSDRRVAPFLEYRWLVEGLKRIPEFMLERGRFEELGWNINVGGKEVGSGFCEWIDWSSRGGASG